MTYSAKFLVESRGASTPQR